MRLKRGFSMLILGVVLTVPAGCGVFSLTPETRAIPARQSIPLSSHGLKEWRLTLAPDLNFNVRYVGHHALLNPEFTLFTKSVHGQHWHQVYTTGTGMVQSRSFGTANPMNNQFVGHAKLVLTWESGKKAHNGYAVYRIRDLKN